MSMTINNCMIRSDEIKDMQDTEVTGQLLMKSSFCEKKLLMIYMKLRRASTHSMRAPKTKRIQASIQASIAVRPSALVGGIW